MTCSVEFGHGWTRLSEVVLPFPQGWLSEQNMRTHVKITKRKECVPSLAGCYFHAHTRISPTLISVRKMRSMVGRRVCTRKRWRKRNFGKRGLRVLVSRELNQQRRRRLRKRHLWSEFALHQTLSRLFHLVQFVKCWQIFLDLNFKGRQYQSSRKEKESWCLLFTSSRKRKTRHFHVLRNVPKSVMRVQSCCFANKNCFLPFSLPSPPSLLPSEE